MSRFVLVCVALLLCGAFGQGDGCPDGTPAGGDVCDEAGKRCNYSPLTCCQGAINQATIYTQIAECVGGAEGADNSWSIQELDVVCHECNYITDDGSDGGDGGDGSDGGDGGDGGTCPENLPSTGDACDASVDGSGCEYAPVTCCEGALNEATQPTAFADCEANGDEDDTWLVSMVDIFCQQCDYEQDSDGGDGDDGDDGQAPPEVCGGFAGTTCSDPEKVCVDDPSDDCLPAHLGGISSDCSGICVSPDEVSPVEDDVNPRCADLSYNDGRDCTADGDYCDYFSWRWNYKNGKCVLLGAGNDCGNFHTKQECVQTCVCPAQRPVRHEECNLRGGQVCYYNEPCCGSSDDNGILQASTTCRCDPVQGWMCAESSCPESCVEDCYSSPGEEEGCFIGTLPSGKCCGAYEDGSVRREDGHFVPCLEKKSLDPLNGNGAIYEQDKWQSMRDKSASSGEALTDGISRWEMGVIYGGAFGMLLTAVIFIVRRKRNQQKQQEENDGQQQENRVEVTTYQ